MFITCLRQIDKKFFDITQLVGQQQPLVCQNFQCLQQPYLLRHFQKKIFGEVLDPHHSVTQWQEFQISPKKNGVLKFFEQVQDPEPVIHGWVDGVLKGKHSLGNIWMVPCLLTLYTVPALLKVALVLQLHPLKWPKIGALNQYCLFSYYMHKMNFGQTYQSAKVQKYFLNRSYAFNGAGTVGCLNLSLEGWEPIYSKSMQSPNLNMVFIP